MKPDIQQLAILMNRKIMELIEDGEVSAPGGTDIHTRDFYGFGPEDIAELHTHKKGAGDGVWFRLKDGRVFDAYGEPAEADPDLYDTVAN